MEDRKDEEDDKEHEANLEQASTRASALVVPSGDLSLVGTEAGAHVVGDDVRAEGRGARHDELGGRRLGRRRTKRKRTA